MGVIIRKAQGETHFSDIYAALCLKLSPTPLPLDANSKKKGRAFKKLLLGKFQEELDTD